MSLSQGKRYARNGSIAETSFIGGFASFLGAMSFSAIFLALVALPVLILFKVAPEWSKQHWQGFLACSAILWTLKTYLEQMMMAELYLCARSDEWAAVEEARTPCRRLAFSAQIMPSLFNGIPDLSGRIRVSR